MNAANVVGYTKCEKDAKSKISNYLANQPTVQGWVGNIVSNQFGSMFQGNNATASNTNKLPV